jgi:hypothetical protein
MKLTNNFLYYAIITSRSWAIWKKSYLTILVKMMLILDK